ncbi:MAG: aminotransferase class I/II-fold pyridoxal phosphate-dependent enzyme [Myxococcota bacterium]
MSDWMDWLDGAMGALDASNLRRELHPLAPEDAVHVQLYGEDVTLFSSNDYLGMSHHPRVRAHLSDVSQSQGLGPRGSPLICGYTESHAALERELAELKGTQSALLCPTGFAANLAVVSSLAGPDVHVFSDRLNHASIIDGCRLAKRRGAKLSVYDHNDTAKLAAQIEASDAERKLVVTDAVFSMDGDLAPLPQLAEICQRDDTMLIVDEAHATLVFGDSGGGLVEHFGEEERVDIHVGTCSKAFGTHGGFVATSQALREFLLNRGRSYIYSTAQPVPVVEASRAALRVATDEPQLRRQLWARVAQLSEALGRPLDSPIVPVILGDEQRALRASETLLERGFHVTAIRPPTVSEGTSRLRIALSAAHSPRDIDGLAEVLREVRTKASG